MKTRLVKQLTFFFWICSVLSSCSTMGQLGAIMGLGYPPSNSSRTSTTSNSMGSSGISNNAGNRSGSKELKLAGSTYSANERAEKQNIANKSKTYDEITERQCQLFSSCLDYSLENLSKPEEHRWVDGRILYLVNFDVVVMLNTNANNIFNLQKQKENLHLLSSQIWRNERNDKYRIIEPIFTMFKIVDDYGEYWFDKSISHYDGGNYSSYISLSEIEDVEYGVYNNYFKTSEYLRFYLHSKSSKLNIKSRESSIFRMITDLRGKHGYKDTEKEYILKNTRTYPVNWGAMSPNRYILRIPLTIAYSLEEKEQISRIRVVLR